ncbi:hypothetical protein B0H14DRAFT_3155240 [Mycena olivaceomarginata]|nr:hypothetical protein B0H14DRAFT_3155240 [Mycena olivaceomarginata]
MYNAQLNGKKSLYISMFKDNSCIEEENKELLRNLRTHEHQCFPRYFSRHGKCGNGTRRRVSPGDRETNGRGAWSRKVRRGQGRPHRTGATAAGSSSCAAFGVDPKEPAQKWAGGGRGVSARGAGQQVWARRLGSNPKDRLQSTNALGQGSSGGRRTRGAWGAIQGTSCSPEIRLAHGVGGRNKRREPGQKRAGRAVGDAGTSTAGIKVAGLGSGDFVGGLKARGIRMGK